MTAERQDKRTTVSLAHVVWDMAETMMAQKGFNDNFSAYVADLVRRDKERCEQTAAQLKDAPITYNLNRKRP
jgi:non-homologous end joining protein Ku